MSLMRFRQHSKLLMPIQAASWNNIEVTVNDGLNPLTFTHTPSAVNESQFLFFPLHFGKERTRNGRASDKESVILYWDR